MSHHTLQKLMVRMLFDEEFVEEVYAAPERALGGLDLTEAERSQLLGVDRRVWRHDPLRRRRTLRTLAEEFKVSTTIILAETRLLASLERFFSSRFFHGSVEERASMGLAFAEFLLDGFKSHDFRDLRRLPFFAPETVEQKLREGKPHRSPFLNRAVKESAREEAFERREEACLRQNDGGRDLELLGQSPERPSSSERIVTPDSAIDAEQLAPLGLRQVESAQGPLRRGVNLFTKLLVEEHPNHKLLKRVVTHLNKEVPDRKMWERKIKNFGTLFLFSSPTFFCREDRI